MLAPKAIFFMGRNMGIRIPNTSVVFNPHTYYTITNLVLFLDLRLLFLDLCLSYLDLVLSFLDVDLSFFGMGLHVGLHQFLGVFQLGLSFLEPGMGL